LLKLLSAAGSTAAAAAQWSINSRHDNVSTMWRSILVQACRFERRRVCACPYHYHATTLTLQRHREHCLLTVL